MSEHAGKIRVSWALLENLLGFDNICELPGSHGLGCTHSRIEICGVEQPRGYVAVDFKVTGGVLEGLKDGADLPRYEATTHTSRDWMELRLW